MPTPIMSVLFIYHYLCFIIFLRESNQFLLIQRAVTSYVPAIKIHIPFDKNSDTSAMHSRLEIL